jgi:hypothetical protein
MGKYNYKNNVTNLYIIIKCKIKKIHSKVHLDTKTINKPKKMILSCHNNQI